MTLTSTISYKVFETNSRFHLEERKYYGKSLISIFQEFFARNYKIFILAGGLHTRVLFYGI